MGERLTVGVAVTDEHLTDYAIPGAAGGSVRVPNSYLAPARTIHEEAVGLAEVLFQCQTFGCYAG